MKILIKGDTCNKIIEIGANGIPQCIGLPVIENTTMNNIIGYSWFNLVDKSCQKYNMPVYEFRHFKIKP